MPSSSPKAVRRIHAGMAGSEAGAMSRFITIARVSTRMRSPSPAPCSAASNPMRFHNASPTWTVPASRTDSIATRSGSTPMVGRAERGCGRGATRHGVVPGYGRCRGARPPGRVVEQSVLAGESCVHPPRDVEPLLGGFGREVAERADGVLARALGGGDRLHRQIAGVGGPVIPFYESMHRGDAWCGAPAVGPQPHHPTAPSRSPAPASPSPRRLLAPARNRQIRSRSSV